VKALIRLADFAACGLNISQPEREKPKPVDDLIRAPNPALRAAKAPRTRSPLHSGALKDGAKEVGKAGSRPSRRVDKVLPEVGRPPPRSLPEPRPPEGVRQAKAAVMMSEGEEERAALSIHECVRARAPEGPARRLIG